MAEPSQSCTICGRDLSDVPLSPELERALAALESTAAKFPAVLPGIGHPLHRELCKRIAYLRDQLAVSPEGGSE